MLFLPMHFGELYIDGIIDTNALSSAIPETDLCKFRILAPLAALNDGPPPDFQIMFANAQLKSPNATVELQFEVGYTKFRDKFIVTTNLTTPLIGLLFLQRHITLFHMHK